VDPLDTDVRIETPEHIVFRHRLAGPARRAVAHLVDLILVYGVLVGLAIIVLLAVGGDLESAKGTTAGMGVGLLLLVAFFAQWVWFGLWEGLRGATPAKLALGLRVVTTTGQPIGLAAAAVRNLLRAADALPTGYVVGAVAMAATRRFQRLGDLAAGTMVVVEPRAVRAAPIRLVPPLDAREAPFVPEEIALDAEERAAIELFLRRLGTLGPAREQELASMVAGALARKHGVRISDPVRALAVLYDRAMARGRDEAPPSSRAEWR
jgi:uncharacterized RDD family membrane protein YckC